MENERARTKGAMIPGTRAHFSRRSDWKTRSTGGTLKWKWDVYLARSKRLGWGDVSNSVFPVFKTLVSTALIFALFLVDLGVVFVQNKGDVKLHLLPFMDLIRQVVQSLINHGCSFPLLRWAEAFRHEWLIQMGSHSWGWTIILVLSAAWECLYPQSSLLVALYYPKMTFYSYICSQTRFTCCYREHKEIILNSAVGPGWLKKKSYFPYPQKC